jgi:hypothetical protein
MKIHDLIIGDLGRKGTLRYFNAFSKAEQSYLTDELDADEFYDEYRMIRYTIVGAIRDIKHEILPDTLEEIEDSCLVGVEGGPSPLDILPHVVSVAVPYVLNAIKMGATQVRVLIPCNTMYTVAIRLRDILSGPQNLKQFISNHDLVTDQALELLDYMRDVRVTVPAVAEEVLQELDELGKERILVAASNSANKAYERVINKYYDHMDFEEWLPTGVDTFSELLQKAFQGEPIDTRSSLKKDSDAVVSACTDIPIPDTFDSVNIFARRLVDDAYQRLNIE